MEYSLVEQGAVYTIYLGDGDIFTMDQSSSLKSETLDTAAKRTAWLHKIFLESDSEQTEEVWIQLLRSVKASEQSSQMLFTSEFPKDTDEEPFRIVGFDVATNNSMGIATSGMSGAIGYFPLHEQRGVWEYLTDENLDRDAVFVLCEMGLEWAVGAE